jgi:hypothetical protein
VTDWRSGGSGSDAKTVDGVELTGFYTQSDATNGAPINITTTQAGTLTIFLGGGVAVNKTVVMSEGGNYINGKLVSTGEEVVSNQNPAKAINAWDCIIYELEANKTYQFKCGGTKWRLAAIRFIASSVPTGISTVQNGVAVSDVYYNLQGVRVANPQKGVFIHNGKKVVIK